MKKCIFTLSMLFATLFLVAQTPNMFNYQAIARDASGATLNSQNISVEFTILEGTTPVFTETHSVTTNSFGLFNLKIGDGTATLSNLSAINFAVGSYSLQVSIDEAGGNNFTLMGTSPLITVPYAMHAKTAESITGTITETDPVFTGWNKDYNDLTNKPNIVDSINTHGFSGNYNDLVNIPDMSNYDTDVADDFDGNYNSLSNIPDMSTWDQNVTDDFDGNYNNLINTPNLSIYATKNMNNENITNLANPINNQDAVNKAYVDALIARIGAIEAILINSGLYILNDIDGNEYNVVKIGNQVWMKENLRVSKYNNGTSIPKVTDATEWSNLTTPAYCFMENDSTTYASTYGALYNWYTIETNELCPVGWHVANDNDWDVLINFLGTEGHTGNEATVLKALTTWSSGLATDEYGFSALGSGGRQSTGTFYGNTSRNRWWTSNRMVRGMKSNELNVSRFTDSDKYGFSVRCVMD